MLATLRIILSCSVLILLLVSCTRDIYNDSLEWYEEIKAEILKQSDLEADSVHTEVNGTWRKEHSYNNGRKFLVRNFNDGNLRTETFYSTNSDFELRREICDRGLVAFEGIFYRGDAYGPSTWYKCDKKMTLRGVRYKGKEIGRWKIRNYHNDKLEDKDYGREELVDSLPRITL
jgi:hypothetical protein